MLLYQKSSKEVALSEEEIQNGLYEALKLLGPRRKVLAIPPDFTRFHSYAGPLTAMADRYYEDRMTDIMPALGTHSAMTDDQIKEMFPGVSGTKFRVHDWRNDVVTLGEVPGDYLK